MLYFGFSGLKTAHLKEWPLANPHCPNKKGVLSSQECIYIGSQFVASDAFTWCNFGIMWNIKQVNRNVNTLLYPRALNWSGNGLSSLGFGLIWLSMNGNPSKACYQPFSEIICFHDSPPPDLAEASWCNGGGGRSRGRRHGTYSQLSFSSLCLVFLDCFGLYHFQHQRALILFELSRCSSSASKS